MASMFVHAHMAVLHFEIITLIRLKHYTVKPAKLKEKKCHLFLQTHGGQRTMKRAHLLKKASTGCHW